MSHPGRDIWNESIEETLDSNAGEIASLNNHLDHIIPIVEAACEYIDALHYAHHNPTKGDYVRKHFAPLRRAVMDYQEWELDL